MPTLDSQGQKHERVPFGIEYSHEESFDFPGKRYCLAPYFKNVGTLKGVAPRGLELLAAWPEIVEVRKGMG